MGLGVFNLFYGVKIRAYHFFFDRTCEFTDGKLLLKVFFPKIRLQLPLTG